MGRRNRRAGTQAAAVWSIAVYLRLSREDGGDTGQEKSRSIRNQREILLQWIAEHIQEPYRIVDCYEDDGLTGTDTSRKRFMEMIAAVEAGTVNCIVCKNLSRIFRNYADQGYYLENYFPDRGVRFISTASPAIDTHSDPEGVYSLEVPITGVMNDRYARTTSKEVRRTFHAKRRKGEFIGAFAPYGYQKHPENKNRLVVDPEAAAVVRDIFGWYANQGMSKAGIAKKLTALGVPTPTQYKQRLARDGKAYHNPSARPGDGSWSASSVHYILGNRVYQGDMVQGRQAVVSYKIHRQIPVPEENWYVVEHTHEAVVSKELFQAAARRLGQDTRTAPGEGKLSLFAGFMRCDACGRAMHRHTAKGHAYYQCRSRSERGLCKTHTIREDRLHKAVLAAVNLQLALVESLPALLEEAVTTPASPALQNRLPHLLEQRRREQEKVNLARAALYRDWKSGELDGESYEMMREKFDEQAGQLSQAVDAIRAELAQPEQGGGEAAPKLRELLRNRKLARLDRAALAALIEAIYVQEDHRIRIKFRTQDQYMRVLRRLEGRDEGQAATRDAGG